MATVRVVTPSVLNPADHISVAANPTVTLATFKLDDLGVYRREGRFPVDVDPRYRIFFVGRDDVHGVLKHIISRVSTSLKMNAYGYDDDELHAIMLKTAADPHVAFQLSLDRSQAGGVHERVLVAEWPQADLGSSVAIGQSASHQISHTKGGVFDGRVWVEGSTNLSASGEGIGLDVETGKAPKGAQNNTLIVSTDPFAASLFSAELDREHYTMVQQMAARKAS